MRVYEVKNKKETLIVAAHNPAQALLVSKFKTAEVKEINIHEPVIISNG